MENIDIDKAVLEYIDKEFRKISISKRRFWKISISISIRRFWKISLYIDKILNRLEFGISNRASKQGCSRE